MPSAVTDTGVVPASKKQMALNLFLSDIDEEHIAYQLDLEIQLVVQILRELDAYNTTATTVATGTELL
ncbi:MAG TPA: hypothetical protein VJP79_06940 [Nitrososphaera sp.]|nr:hypothetical protein [Nitrososphaera sp.]